MAVGERIIRKDALQKVTGTAKYVEDLIPADALHVKVVHSTIANGVVKHIDKSDAESMPGVEGIFTCFDVPDRLYATAGHPLSIDPEKGDVKDKHILEKRIRYYGDDVAAVVADTPLHALLAAEKVHVEYEEYKPSFTEKDSMESTEPPMHAAFPTNELSRMDFTIDGEGKTHFYKGTFSVDDEIAGRTDLRGDHYTVPKVHACHMENQGCFAYMDGDRIVIVSCNQVPFTLRQNIANALGIPVGRIRVIKPYLGGGFGNKQDTMYEPLAAFLTMKLGGRPISIQLTREETFVNTRSRHAFEMNMLTEVDAEGTITKKALRINTNGGAYAAHVHAVTAYAITNFFETYLVHGEQIGESSTVYTNLPSPGALRGYGIPQVCFAMESQMDDIAKEHGFDPVDFRLKNIQPLGFIDPFDRFRVESNGLKECILRGRKLSRWDEKRKEYDEFNKTSEDIKKGIGMAIFAYKTGVWPIQMETSACRMIMNADGSMQVQVGATELGQGSDTAFAQITSEITTVPEEKITVVSMQDTDVSPYDNGAYASRQTYISGAAVKQTAEKLKEKILKYASLIRQLPKESLNLKDDHVVDPSGDVVCSIQDVCTYMNFAFSRDWKNQHITAESTYTMRANCFAYGASYADVEVDVPVGKVKVRKIWAIHDSGKIINPQLAEMQVHGGIAMGVGYALGEQLIFDPATGKARNNNFLDYKIPTIMDMPEMEVEFVETNEPSAPFGNKALGEPPLIPQAPAIRNAILHATGVGFYDLPMNPQRLVHGFLQAGLI